MNRLLYLAISLLALIVHFTDAQVGVCYGMLGDNLPSSPEVVALYKEHNIKMTRLFDPNHPALDALRASDIDVILGVPNSDLQNLAAGQENADAWVLQNVRSFTDVKFRYIGVGNEVGPNERQFVLPAMQNIGTAISAASLNIKVSTVIETGLLGASYPPENGAFNSDVIPYIAPIVRFLVDNDAPLLVNVYPYFAYIDNKEQISLEYALFTSEGIVVPSGARYQNLFYAIVDATYAALEKVGGSTVRIVVSESGWPSMGGDTTTVDYATTYLTNLIQRVQTGTPMRPGQPIETYIFATFDENEKSPEYEKKFGIFTPDKQLKYPISFGPRPGIIYHE